MPVSVEEVAYNTSDTSSASTHFKRKMPHKQIPVGHRPVTRSLTNFGSANPNPLNGEDPQASSEDGSPSPHSESEPGDAEQVLATTKGQSIEEQMNRMMAALQQKEEELAVLRE